jgi:hypothetical protein
VATVPSRSVPAVLSPISAFSLFSSADSISTVYLLARLLQRCRAWMMMSAASGGSSITAAVVLRVQAADDRPSSSLTRRSGGGVAG